MSRHWSGRKVKQGKLDDALGARRNIVGRNVIHRQGVTGFEQIGCHWVAHVANANEKDMGQGSH
jgi:hypothetical protein